MMLYKLRWSKQKQKNIYIHLFPFFEAAGQNTKQTQTHNFSTPTEEMITVCFHKWSL